MKLTRYRSIFEKINSYFWAEADGPIFLSEGVVSPKYYSEIEKYLYSLKKKILSIQYKNLKQLCRTLTNYTKKYAIKFVVDENSENNKYIDKEYQAGISHSGCLSNRKGTVKIYCNDNLLRLNKNNEKFFDYFVKNVIRIMGHELIHRNQIFDIHNQKLRNLIMSNSDANKKDIIKYLTSKQELMARAWQIIEEFRYEGLNDSQIMNILRSNKDTRLVAFSPVFMDYLRFFNIKDPIFKQLWKYAYLYLTNQEVR